MRGSGDLRELLDDKELIRSRANRGATAGTDFGSTRVAVSIAGKPRV